VQIIIIGGSHSGVGKTRAAELALQNLRNARYAAIKLTVADGDRGPEHDHGVGAVRLASAAGACGRGASCGVCETVSTAVPSRLISAPRAIGKVGTDTWRLAQAGALAVVWIIALRDAAASAVAQASAALQAKGARGILIEGTSALDWIDPRLSVMVATDPGRAWKDVARRRVRECDIVLRNLTPQPPGILPAPPEFASANPVVCDLGRIDDPGTQWFARQIRDVCLTTVVGESAHS